MKKEHIHNEIKKIVIGREKEIDLLLIALLQGGHVLIESVPGTGKTLLAKTFASVIGGQFKRIQFTPDVLPSDVTGIKYFNPKTQLFELRSGPVLTNFLLADEINRATPRTQSSLLEAMEEQQVTIDSETIKIDSPFIVIATQNPVESQQGTFPLPFAQLDRFLFKLPFNYPTLDEERKIIQQWTSKLENSPVNAITSITELSKMQLEVREVKVSSDIETYIVEIIRQTRQHPLIEWGASPRAAVALVKASQGFAYLANRDYVKPEDVKEVASFVLLHRLQLTSEAFLTKNTEMVLKEVLNEIDTPVEMKV